jgi:ABC-type multidrug transport system fused ATPase/permease subunit
MNHIGSPDFSKFLVILVVFELLMPFYNVCTRMYKANVKENFSKRYSDALFTKAQHLSIKELEDFSIPTLTTSIQYNTDNSDAIVTLPVSVVNCIVSFITAFIIMANEDLRLTGIIILMNTSIGFVFYYLVKGFKELVENIRKSSKQINACISHMEAYLVTKSFGKEEYEIDNFKAASSNLLNACLKKIHRTFAQNFWIGLLYSLEDTAIVFYIAKTYDGNLAASISKGLLFYSLSYYLFRPFDQLPDITDQISSLFVHLKENEDLLNKEDEYDGEIEIHDFDSSIEFKDVSFAYNDTANTLEHINVKIKKGMKVGIYGKSGCGKSTFVNLINRFFLPNEGTILIDGIDIRKFTKSSLRRIIGNVNQEITIFSDLTIRENIKYGINCTDVEMVKAAKLANCHKFITELPDGYDSKIGNNGVKLSGGEKQRLAIARLFLLNPKILIMDEATSKLDNESEQLIKESIEKLSKDKTVISIAHRFNTIENSDLFIGIKDHTICESGTKEDISVPGSLWNQLSHGTTKGGKA